jgi:hypothetical protein
MARGVSHFWYGALFMLMTLCCSTPAEANTSSNSARKPFLLSSTSQNNPWVGQEIVLTYMLYFKDDAPKIFKEENPSFKGLWASESSPERYIKSIPATVQGVHFRSAVVKQFRVAPVQKGKITISGYSMLCSFPQELPSGKESNTPDIRLHLTAPEVSIFARALPEPVPEGFSGAVGTFHMELITDKENVRIGEPLSLKLAITGKGSLQTIKLPDLHLPESFRQSQPDRAITPNTKSDENSGTLSATFAVWPQAEGKFQIPAVKVVVFNPETSKFITLRSNPILINVNKPAQGATPSDTLKPAKSINIDLNANGNLWITAAIALLLLFGTLLFLSGKFRQKQQINNGQEVRSTEPIADVSQSAANVRQQLFAIFEENGIQSPCGLTRKELDTALIKKGTPDTIRSEITDLLDALDRILYAPSPNQAAVVLERIAAKAESLKQQLQKIGNPPLK